MRLQHCKCNYCTKNGWPLLWVLPNGDNWFEIPKNGSWTIKSTFNRKLKRFRKHQGYPDSLKEKPTLIVWRDPIERFESLFKHYMIKQGIRYKLTEKYFQRQGIDLAKIPVNDRLKLMMDHIEHFSSLEEVHHFYPQTYFIDQNKFANYKILPLEELSVYLKVPVKNATKSDYSLILPDNFEKEVREYYSEDYAFYEKHIR